MIFWLLIVLLALHIVGAFFMTPPTALSDKFFNSFSRHPRLREEAVSSAQVNGKPLRDDEKAQLIQAMNTANFLFEGGLVQEQNVNPITVQITQRKAHFTFKMYLYGDQMIEVIRYKGKKYAPYRLRSQELESFLLSHNQVLDEAR